MSVATDKASLRASASAALTAIEDDGTGLTETQQQGIASMEADIASEEASNFDVEDARTASQSSGNGLPYGLRTTALLPSITSALTKSATEGSAISTYNVTGSRSPSTYSATGLPPGLSINSSTGAITGTPTKSGTFNATIFATNSHGSGSATLVFTVASVKPVITSALAAAGTHSSAFSYQIAASNSPTTFTATGLPSGLNLNASTGVISGTLGAGTAGVSNITIGAANASETSDPATLVLTIS